MIKTKSEDICLYTIYSCYQAVSPEERAKSIYEYMAKDEFKNIEIIDAFKLGIEKVSDEYNFSYCLIMT